MGAGFPKPIIQQPAHPTGGQVQIHRFTVADRASPDPLQKLRQRKSLCIDSSAVFLEPLDDQWIVVDVDEIGQMMTIAVFIRCPGITGTKGAGIILDGVLPFANSKV